MGIILSGVSYRYRNQQFLFEGLDLSVAAGAKVSLVGDNGTGKSTLLKLIAGELAPSSGSIVCPSRPYYVPQQAGIAGISVARALGVDGKVGALRAICAGSTDAACYDILADDWEVEARCRAALDGWGLPHVGLDSPVDTLSGGEKTRLLLAGVAVHAPAVILLDEPTNHLDASGRRKLCDFVCGSRATILVVSHDAELLDLVGTTCELTPQGLKVYGGNFAFCREQRQAEEAALERQVASAEAALQLARRKAREIRERQEKRMRAGERHKDGLPRILRKTFKDSGERTDSRLGDKHAGLVDDARQRLGELRRRRREACELKIDFDDARLHDGKLLVSARGVNVEHTPGHPLWRVPVDLEVRSGERILLAGDNGSGKTTLVRLLAGELQPSSGQVVRTAFSHVWLDQEYGMAATPRSVLELAQCHNSGGLPEHGLKMRLHRALFPEALWDKRCDTLSGGERMRLCLCCLMISNSVPDLLVLDEPTNNLDLGSLGILARAIAEYRGTLLVVTHDRYFAREVGITRTVALPPPE